MAVEGKVNAMQEEQNLEKPVSSEGMLKSFAMTRSFQNRPIRRFHKILISNSSRVKARVDKRFFGSSVLSEALRQFSRRTFGKRRSLSFTQGGASKEKGKKWSALAMTLPSGISGDQGIQPESTSLSSRTFSSGSSIPAFSLPDQGSVFSQVSSAVEQAVSKPKWKPPEPGARRFSRVEEVKSSMGADTPSTLGTVPDTVTTLQKSPKPSPQATPTKPANARPSVAVKPTQATARQSVTVIPASREPESQSSKPEHSMTQSRPSQQHLDPMLQPVAQKSQFPIRSVNTSSPALPTAGAQTPPAAVQSKVPREASTNIQPPSSERSQALTRISSEGLPKAQTPTAGNVASQTPSPEPVAPVQMPLTPRRGLQAVKKSRQNLISQHRYHLSRPRLVLSKAGKALAIQRKSFQLPLKRRVYSPTQPASAVAREPDTATLPVSHNFGQLVRSVQVPAFEQTLPILASKTPSSAASERSKDAAPSLPMAAQNAPLQRKSLHLPLKRPLSDARKPSAAQARRLNIAAMPLRRAPAKVPAKKQDDFNEPTLTPATSNLSPTKPSISSQLAAPKADLSTKLPANSFQTPAPKADLSTKSPIDSHQATETSGLSNLALPLISKAILQRVSGRIQMLRATPFVHSQQTPASLTSVRPTLTRVSSLPGQSIQRSLRQGRPVTSTRIIPRQQSSTAESFAGSWVKFPDLSAQPTRFEAALPAKKPLKFAHLSTEKPSPLPEPRPIPQQETQVPQSAPQPVLQPRRKTASMKALPPTINKNKILSLTALRKGKPVLAPHSVNQVASNEKQAELNRQTKLEDNPAAAGPAPKQSISPVRAIKSSPVVQRKLTPEDERRQTQSNNQGLPLATQPLGPQPGSARQNEIGFPSSSDRKSSQQQPTSPESPLPSGYVNPFADEPRPEMPLRTPIRPNTFENSSQPGQQSSDQPGALMEEVHTADSGGAIPPQSDAQNRPNLQELARKVYPEIVRMLNVETEWLGRRL